MKNFILKNKVKILFTLLFAFLLLTLSNNVFATFTFTHDDISYTFNTLPDSPYFNKEYFSILKSGDNFLFLSYVGFNPDTMTIINTNKLSGYSGIANKSTGSISSARVKFWTYDTNTSSYSFDDWQPDSAFYQYYDGSEKSDNYIYSTVPIYLATGLGDKGTYSISEDVFFQVAPPEEEKPEVPEIPEEETPKATTLPEIMEQVEKEAVLKEIVALLPVILSVLVSLIALRKALKMLFAFLRVS